MAIDGPAALIADDEPLLRQSLRRMLQRAWPELRIVAEARNGSEAVKLFETHRPQICFLDVKMPGLSGVDAARRIGPGVHLVFVTAFTDYAVEAFEHGALDYLVKPVEPGRLEDTVSRLKARVHTPASEDALARLEELAARLANQPSAAPLRWIKASVGASVQLIPVSQVDYLQSDEKYTVVAWRDADGACRNSIVRIALRELVAQLDPSLFAQVHRSFAINMAAVSHVIRQENETGIIHLRNRKETIPVSRSRLHLFRQM